jgi:hypothetical protein
MTYEDALAALADPTRRKVFERLRDGPQPVNVLAAGLTARGIAAPEGSEGRGARPRT